MDKNDRPSFARTLIGCDALFADLKLARVRRGPEKGYSVMSASLRFVQAKCALSNVVSNGIAEAAPGPGSGVFL